MLRNDDLHSQVVTADLLAKSGWVGSMHATYHVQRVYDVRNLTSRVVYRVQCVQRITVPNPHQFTLAPDRGEGFMNYPVALACRASLPERISDARLVDYNPRTLNSTVNTTSNQDDGRTSTDIRQHTSGSSNSTTNTYGFSVSAGATAEGPTGSVGGEYTHSTMNEVNRSNMLGHDVSAEHRSSASESMSLKDWASYAALDRTGLAPTWTWAQEYPWDVIRYRNSIIGETIQLPDYIRSRMFLSLDPTSAPLPPSHLALFGVDFVMKATWDIVLPPEIADQTVILTHDIDRITASHENRDSSHVVTLNPADETTVISPAIDLTLLGLDPIGSIARASGAVIGFAPNKFLTAPKDGSQFKILSDANTLQVVGEGFDAGGSGVRAIFSQKSVSLRIWFKVVDFSSEFVLYLKHWVDPNQACQLRLTFNGDEHTVITRHVEASEGAGGEDNITAIALRNLDYTSIDYHDYLKPGLNVIDVEVTAQDAHTAYTLRTIAIG